jgi:hypothetical protein
MSDLSGATADLITRDSIIAASNPRLCREIARAARAGS